MWLTACDSGESVSGSGFSRSDGDAAQNPIQVTATVGMVADLVRQVGGEQVQVTQICGPGVDPHLYKATRDDVQTMMNADMIFYCGLMLEGKMTDTLVKMARQKPVVAVTEILEPSILLEPEDFSGHYDPHVWMDVAAWSEGIAAVQNALSELRPDAAANFQAGAQRYSAELAALHAYAEQTLASIPAVAPSRKLSSPACRPDAMVWMTVSSTIPNPKKTDSTAPMAASSESRVRRAIHSTITSPTAADAAHGADGS